METMFIASIGPKGRRNYRKATRQEVLENAAKYNQSAIVGTDVVSNPKSTRAFLSQNYGGFEHEIFGVLFLDTRHRVLAHEILFRGTIDGASVHPREVAKRCLDHNAAAVILFHNHPSGVCEPSGADQTITRRLQETLSLLDVNVLDHIIVGHGSQTSFAERGLL